MAAAGGLGVGAACAGARGSGGGARLVGGTTPTGVGARRRSARAERRVGGVLPHGVASPTGRSPERGRSIGSNCSIDLRRPRDIGFGPFAVGDCVEPTAGCRGGRVGWRRYGVVAARKRILWARRCRRTLGLVGGAANGFRRRFGRARPASPVVPRRLSFTSSNARKETPWIHGFTWPWS